MAGDEQYTTPAPVGPPAAQAPLDRRAATEAGCT